MKKAIVNISNGWKMIDCRCTCSSAEMKGCVHFDSMRRNLRSEGGLELCHYIRNGLIEVNDKYSNYVNQSVAEVGK